MVIIPAFTVPVTIHGALMEGYAWSNVSGNPNVNIILRVIFGQRWWFLLDIF